jgi:hypothetical protein
MMIDHIDVERPDGRFYVLTICGEGFGDRSGQVSVWNTDGVLVPHVDIKSWYDAKISVEVTDAAENTGSGLMVGKAMVEVVPVPGMVMEFDVPAADASDPVHTGNYDALAEHAASLGIKVDKRWGEDRLRHEIEAAESSSE